MGEFVFLVTLCMSTTSNMITDVVRANSEAGAMTAAVRAHPGYQVCGRPKQLGS